MIGSSLALLMNPIIPLLAEIMVSHAWGEDIEETMQALNMEIPDKDKVIWFCIYANYQPEDGAGPSLEEQIAMEPFKQVIAIPILEKMIVVHTTTTESYDRKWCAHEIDEAIECGVKIGPACCLSYILYVSSGDIDIKVDTKNAKCSQKSDANYIDNIILAKEGGFERLNKRVEDFRRQLMTMKIEIELPAGQLGIECRGIPPRIVNILPDSPLVGSGNHDP